MYVQDLEINNFLFHIRYEAGDSELHSYECASMSARGFSCFYWVSMFDEESAVVRDFTIIHDN